MRVYRFIFRVRQTDLAWQVLFRFIRKVGVPGVVASMRLKWLRDGVEDYDYVQILNDLGREDLAMQIARSVGPDWTNWTRDHAKLYAARQMTGLHLEFWGSEAELPVGLR